MNLLQQYQAYIRSNNLFNPKDTLLLAVSGGVDSVSLCELTRQAGYDFAIAHCNFRLRDKESERDKEFVENLGKKYGVKCFVKEFETEKYAKENKLSIQEAARKLRYEWFDEMLKTNILRLSYIVTAHHADDNIETVLMNFFRGTGIKGLKGIEPKQGKIVRPLIFARRSQLEGFIAQNKLEYVTDSSNLKEDYSRNYFRLTVIPMLQKVFPEVNQNVLHNIDRFRDASTLYEQAIATHKKKLLEYNGSAIHIPFLKLKKSDPLKTLVYEIVKEWNFNPNQVDEIISLLDSETGKYICSATHRILKNRKWIIVTPLSATQPEIILIEENTDRIEFEQGYLKIEKNQNSFPIRWEKIPGSKECAFLDAKKILFPLILRKWKPGDYFYPLGMINLHDGKPGKKKLTRFFIDQKLSKADKEKIWVLEMNKKILWVVGHRIDDRFKISEHTKSAMKITFTNRQTG